MNGVARDSDHSLSIAVGIATAGRRDVISRTIQLVSQQNRTPDLIVVCPAASADVDWDVEQAVAPFKVVMGPRGLPAQRNRILAELRDHDVVVFFDDDFFPAPDYLVEIERMFRSRPDIVAVTGRPVKDGANGPGLSVEDGLLIVARAIRPERETIAETYGTYGCNMAFRMAPIRAHQLVFDENLPLYGWQEDIDFSRQLSPYGRIVESDWLLGAHLGTKRGRTSGIRFGYSQIANPIYLMNKGTLSRSFARPLMIRNIVANIVRSGWPEPWIDRRGRLKGNLLALIDLMMGRISPGRILSLD